MGGLDTNGYYALGLPLYLLLGAVDVLVARRRNERIHGFADTLGNLSAGLGEVVIGLFIGPLLYGLYELGYERLALFHWQPYSIASWIAAFLVSDFCYYWYHRAGHRVGLFWAIHGVHHQSEEFNLTLALRHPWFSDFYSAIFYVPLPLLGIPPMQFFAAITLISFYALTIHSFSFGRPGFFFFVTPRTHVLHHAKNPRYLGKNLGAMLTIWDRWFGTYVEPEMDDPPLLGMPQGYRTHDGARSQWILFGDLWKASRRATSFRDRLRIWLGRPRGAGVPSPRPRGDADIPFLDKVYSVLQLSLMMTLAADLLWRREAHSLVASVCGAALILWGLSTLGGILDGRASAKRQELWRLAAAIAYGALLTAIPGQRVRGYLICAGALCLAAVWLAADQRRAAFQAASTSCSRSGERPARSFARRASGNDFQ